ncbi:DEAD/DEAH box helicase [Pseudoalteromonas aurantia]|uniref:ATP-dependent helicase n=1 Tax=Pseudoalteromonas aurantia TaxID=43654 RepID=A0A5S3VAK3_9GAMM|nr:DEAD/DEAH box helicase [Pseudoalteromonas aurantia]TMO68975.1 ATP-dependent helicase [Pseudoalteromonas aurantia]
MTHLPIEAIKLEFLSTIAHSDVIVSAATGSGKSTCLPLWASQSGRVLVIEPRRIACTSLAEYLAQQSSQPVGEKIGYAIRFESHCSENTEVVFVTPGVALRWFFEDKLHEFNIVMLDEFHERRWDMDLLLAMLKQHDQHRLIVTSATLNTAQLASYLNAKILHSEGSMYPVDEQFIANNSRAMPSKEQLAERVINACQQAILKTPDDILIFLPGKAEIQACAAAAKKLNTLVVSLYGGCSAQQQALALSVQSQQRLIFATNVAETSLTIPNISCVIDSGLERRTHLRGTKTVLGLDAISIDSAKQRLGRAGRTQHGLCIRLYGQHAPLIKSTPPEVNRENLTELVLAAACSSDGIKSLSFIDPLPEKSKASAISLLNSIGALAATGVATEYGKALYPLPIDATLAHLIHSMPTSSLMQAMIDVVAIMSVPARIYHLPSQQDLLEQINILLPNRCDLELAIAIMREQISTIDIALDAFQEAKQFSELLRSTFALPELKYAASYDHNLLVESIAAARPNCVFIKRNNKRGAFGNGLSEVVLSKSSRIDDKSKAMLVLDTYALAGQGTKQSNTLATLNAPVNIAIIKKLSLGTYLSESPEIIDNVIFINSLYTYAGVTLESKKVAAQGPQLITACCELIVQGLLFAPAGKQIHDALKYHELYNQAHDIEHKLPEKKEYILHTLQSLGITEQSDLALIEAEDLFYTRLEPWLIEPFIEKYPIEVHLNELSLNINYQFMVKRITLEYVSGKRKEVPKRWELPAWQGFKIRYKKASRVIDIK